MYSDILLLVYIYIFLYIYIYIYCIFSLPNLTVQDIWYSSSPFIIILIVKAACKENPSCHILQFTSLAKNILKPVAVVV